MMTRVQASMGSRFGWGPWTIIAVGLLEVAIFGHCCWVRWEHRRANRPATLRGEGMILGGDGLGYYAWLRSAMIDGDWSFDNEFDEHNPLGHGVPPPERRTELGLRGNHYPIGQALVWAPAVIVTHLALKYGLADALGWPADGYSLPYQLAVGLSSLVVSLIGLGFLYAICRRYAGPGRAAFAAGALTLGTTIFFYSSIEVSMAHGAGMAALAGLVWYWLKTYGSLSPWRWLMVGAIIGFATMLRSQLGTFVMLPFAEAMLICWRSLKAGRNDWARALANLALAGVAAFVVFTPQLCCWRCVYGHWWAMPHLLAHRWRNPALWQLLFARDRSLFYWTPITLLALIGTLMYCFKRSWPTRAEGADSPSAYDREPLILLALSFAAQVYFVGGAWGPGVSLGASFGFRLLTEALVVLAPGLALLLSQTRPSQARLIAAACCLLVLWNFVLIREYSLHLLPGDGGAGPLTLLSNVPKALGLF